MLVSERVTKVSDWGDEFTGGTNLLVGPVELTGGSDQMLDQILHLQAKETRVGQVRWFGKT